MSPTLDLHVRHEIGTARQNLMPVYDYVVSGLSVSLGGALHSYALSDVNI
jgi:hypothetical protein